MTINRNIFIDPQDSLMVRFLNHAKLGIYQDIQDHTKNRIEKAGDLILWNKEKLPSIVWEKMKEPRVVTVALTKLALITNSFVWYPTKSLETAQICYEYLPLPPTWAVKFTGYLSTCGLIVGYALRAYGRFSNKELMDKAYLPEPINRSVKLA